MPDPPPSANAVSATRRTNEQWLDSLRADPPAATAIAELREILRRGLLRSLAGRTEVGDADVDDFAQEAVIRVLDRLDSFRGDSRFTTWAMAVGIRIAWTTLRRRRWGDRSLDDLDLPRGGDGDGSDPAATSARRDVLTALRDAIEGVLTPRQRVAVLAELAGMPTGVLVEQLGTNPNALYKLHHDARRRLRHALEQAGFTETDVKLAGEGAST